MKSLAKEVMIYENGRILQEVLGNEYKQIWDVSQLHLSIIIIALSWGECPKVTSYIYQFKKLDESAFVCSSIIVLDAQCKEQLGSRGKGREAYLDLTVGITAHTIIRISTRTYKGISISETSKRKNFRNNYSNNYVRPWALRFWQRDSDIAL